MPIAETIQQLLADPRLAQLANEYDASPGEKPQTHPRRQLAFSASIAADPVGILKGEGNAAIAYGRGAAIAAELGGTELAT
jgi:hypothetical protein